MITIGDMALSTRRATRDDYEFLHDLHVSTMREYVARTWGWDEALQAQMFRGRFDPTKIEIIEWDGQSVGMWLVTEDESEIHLRSIEIAPAYQGRGYGTSLINALLLRASVDRRTVRLEVLKVNPARMLYERLGFEPVGETPTHVVMATKRATRL
jgi:ribosomal protein S18 acetylase RimI-like enzyme